MAKSKKSENKTVPLKKIPGLFRKNYSEKKFNKKLTGKISIPEDKEFILKLYKTGLVEKHPEFYSIPKDTVFTVNEVKRLKILAKEIKGQKGRFKLLPLVAVICFLAAMIITVNVFKNPVAKKIIKGSLETVFSAKTDIQSVKISFLDASINVNGLAVGNKNSEFKNLFEIENINIDFHLAKALCGFFDAQNLEVNGMDFNTDRKTSCALPKKEKKQKKENSDNAFMLALNKKTQDAIENLRLQINEIFGGDDINSIVENITSQLKTPSAAEEAKTTSVEMIDKWKNVPATLQKQINDFSRDVNKLSTIDVNKISDVTILKSNLEKINAAIVSSKKLKTSVDSITADIKTDVEKVSVVSKKLTAAVNEDKDFAQSKLNEAVDTVKNAKQIFSNAMDTVACSYLGKYYPYAKRAVSFAQEMKNNATVQKIAEETVKINNAKKAVKAKAPASEKKKNSRRLKGVNLYFGKAHPKFLVERAAVSGKGFSAEITELTSNQDLRGKPLTAKADFDIQAVNHKASFVLDARSYSKEPLISLSYDGNGFNTVFDGKTIAENSGIPNINAKTNLSMKAAFGNNYFSASGDVNLNPLTLTSDGFNNALVDKYYFQALESVKNMKVNYGINYSEADGIKIDLGGNFADTFASTVKSVAVSMGADAKKAALAKVNEKINSSSQETQDFIKKFTEISQDINSREKAVAELQKTLENKKNEIEAKITAAAKNEIKKQAAGAVKGLLTR